MATMLSSGTILQELGARVDTAVRIREVQMGPFWTGVRTDAGVGMAATCPDFMFSQAQADFPLVGRLLGSRFDEVWEEACDAGTLGRSFALALLNSCGSDVEVRRDLNVLDLIAKCNPARVGLVGHFPFAEKLRQRVDELVIFELPWRTGPGDIPNTRMLEFLPGLDVLAITASALITRTLEEILNLASPGTIKILLGPTTPMSSLLWNYGFDALCGVDLTPSSLLLQAMGHGANLSQLPGVTKVTALNPHSSGASRLFL